MKEKKRYMKWGIIWCSIIGVMMWGKPVMVSATNVATRIAVATKAKVNLDGKQVVLPTYNIEGNNYVKLRAIAVVMADSEVPFSVNWDDAKAAIRIGVGENYDATGDELKSAGNQSVKAVTSTSPIYRGEEIVTMQAYRIDGANYFQLRDVAKTLDCYLNWDSIAGQIVIDSKRDASGGIRQQDDWSVVTKDPDLALSEDKAESGIQVDVSRLTLPAGKPIKTPTTQEEFKEVIYYMMSNRLATYSFTYDEALYKQFRSGELMQKIGDAHEALFDYYIEYFCYKNQISLSVKGYEHSGTMTLKLEHEDFSHEKSLEMLDAFMGSAKQIVEELIAAEKITAQMSQTEIARVLYEWVVTTLSYDTNYKKAGYTGYGAVTDKTAVCQGYIALYNTMCKLVGIEIWGVGGTTKDGTNHIWSEAILDGKKVYIDPTFGDPVPDVKGACDFNYFAVDAAYLRKTHNW